MKEKNTNKTKFAKYLVVVLIFVSLSNYSYADAWYPGTSHVHTGFSTNLGYPGQSNSGCSWTLEGGNPSSLSSGYTVSQLVQQSKNFNLYWDSFTDHSYCMSSNEFNVVKTGCQNAEQPGTFTCLSGEEVSAKETVSDYESVTFLNCLLKQNGEAHVGAQGIGTYISQTPVDEHCPESPTVSTAISNINSQGGISIANHPFSYYGVVEFLDLEGIDILSGETGIEIWNGQWTGGYADNVAAVEKWKEKLLDGEKVYGFGGTDSHESIIVPNYNYAFVQGTLNQNNLKNALKLGKVTVSNNGLVWVEAKGEHNSNWTMQGGTINICYGDDVNIRANYNGISTSCSLRILSGDNGGSNENYWSFGSISGPGLTTNILNSGVTISKYYRADCINGNKRIYTNPVFVDIDYSQSDYDGICDSADCSPSNSFVYPGNTNSYCDCIGTYTQGTTEISGDGIDNDCNGQIDEGSSCTNGLTMLCPKQQGVCNGATQTCTGGSWSSCSYGSYYESSETLCDNRDNDCNGLVDEPVSCAAGRSCRTDEIEQSCTINEADSYAQLYLSDRDADSSYGDLSICGQNKCYQGLAMGASFDVYDDNYGDCPNNIENRLNDISEVILRFQNNRGTNPSCKNTDLVRYDVDESDISVPISTSEAYELTDVNNWNTVLDLGSTFCGSINLIDITTDFINNLHHDDNSVIVYGWWPISNQKLWSANTNEIRLLIDYCDDCPDIDNDKHHDDTSGCGTDNDCNDNNPNIYGGNPNSFCDCSNSDGYAQGRTETCDGKDDDCDGQIDEGCDDDNDNYCDNSMTNNGAPTCPNTLGDCNDNDPSANPGFTELCDDGIDNDCDGYVDYADSQCAQKSDGDYCLSTQACLSGFCDIDNQGLADDHWCFTPLNTFFDGEQPTSCEYSTGNGIVDCDERTSGDDLHKCVGTTYYQDECSNSCGYQDITSKFDCSETGCSCSQSLCDGLTTGSSITTCAANQTYFADKCTSNAGGQDRGDNICRNATFAAGCTADADCNGVRAGTGYCDANCHYTGFLNLLIKDSSDVNLARFDSVGQIVLKGNCSYSATCTAPADSFIFKDSTGSEVAHISPTGNLCIETGDCSNQSASCNPTHDSFIIRDSTGKNVSYIDLTNGDLCLTGTLIQNGNP